MIFFLIFSPTTSWADIKRMSNDQIYKVINLIAPDKEILHEIESINPPSMVFVFHGYSGRVSDIYSEKDPFTGKKKYKYSLIRCTHNATYFTPILDNDVHADGAIYFEGKSDNTTRLMWIGYGATNVLNSSMEDAEFKIIYGLGGNVGSETYKEENYTSTEDAEKSIQSECSNKSVKNIKLMDISAHHENDGFLIRGASERIPTVGNSKIVIME